MSVQMAIIINVEIIVGKVRKAVPLQAWSDPEGSRKLRFPDFMTTAQDGGKVFSLTHRPPLPPGNYVRIRTKLPVRTKFTKKGKITRNL